MFSSAPCADAHISFTHNTHNTPTQPHNSSPMRRPAMSCLPAGAASCACRCACGPPPWASSCSESLFIAVRAQFTVRQRRPVARCVPLVAAAPLPHHPHPPLPTQIPTSYEAAHAEIAAEAPGAAYYYLAFIATAPAARGRGLAGGLLRHMTARADDEGRLCLLEATRCADVLCTCRGHIVIARGGGW